jgi:hypothetical protein
MKRAAVAVLGLLWSSSAGADPVDRWIAAGETAALARAERDAVLMTAAARQRALAEAEDGSLAGADANAAALMAEARRLAGPDRVAGAVIDRYTGMIPRGSSGGTALQSLDLPPGKSVVVPRRFAVGRSAIVYVEGHGPYRLLVVNGATICDRQLAAGEALCRFLPHAAGETRVEVHNLDARALRLTLITN